MNLRKLAADELLDLAVEVLSRGGSLTLLASGHSMVPAIADGDRVSLRPAGAGSPRLGDVWLVATSKGARLHRLVSSGRNHLGAWFRVKGDAATGALEHVSRADLVGRVVRIDRSASRFLSSRWWRVRVFE